MYLFVSHPSCQAFEFFAGRYSHTSYSQGRNYGYITRVGNVRLEGGPREVDSAVGQLCHDMGTAASTVKLDMLHVCDNGPLTGQYVTVHRLPTETNVLEISEVVMWPGLALEDRSRSHGTCFL